MKKHFNAQDVDRLDKIMELLSEDSEIVVEPVEVEKMSFKKDILYDIDELINFGMATFGYLLAIVSIVGAVLKFISR